MNPLSGSNLTDLFFVLILFLTCAVLCVFWIGALIVTAIQLVKINELPRAFFQFLFVNVFLLINFLVFYFFTHWENSHPNRDYFSQSDDVYLVFWLPLNLVFVVVLAETVYRAIAKYRAMNVE